MSEELIESTIQIEIPSFSEKYVNQQTVTFLLLTTWIFTQIKNGRSKSKREGPCGYTSLFYDRKFQRVFLTNEMGMVDVYLTQNYPSTLVNSILTSSELSIRGNCIDLQKSYIFTAAKNGQIVKYHKAANELSTEDQDGRISIWSLKTGQTIYT